MISRRESGQERQCIALELSIQALKEGHRRYTGSGMCCFDASARSYNTLHARGLYFLPYMI